MKTAHEELQSYSYESIKKGSLSFSFATHLFGKELRDKVVKLYAWCRFLDNQIDAEADKGSKAEAIALLRSLEEQSFGPEDDPKAPLAIQAFRALQREVQLPREQAQEMIYGMDMDLQELRYETMEDLRLYCFRVAGVVGLMMSRLMGVSSPVAYEHATDLGLAMQLTNICRDVGEDAAMGRVYLPLAWLREAGISDPDQLLRPEYRESLVAVVKRVLDTADGLYHSGDQGLRYLPARCAFAIAVAREVYAAIGHEVRARGGQAWDRRVWIPLRWKLWFALKGCGRVLATFPYRFQQALRGTEERSLPL